MEDVAGIEAVEVGSGLIIRVVMVGKLKLKIGFDLMI